MRWIRKILNIEFRYFGITQRDDLLDSFQALYGNKSIRRQILQKIFVSDLRELPVGFDMSLKNGEAPFLLSAHDHAGFDERLDKVLYDLRILLIKDSALMKGLEGKAIRLKSYSTLIPSP